MNEAEVHHALTEQGAVTTGHFKLSSGLHSDTYVQCALALQHPGLAERFGHELASRFADAKPTVVLGPAMGGLIIGHEVARCLGVRSVFCERVEGVMTMRRGLAFAPRDRVLVVEDVVTTGRSPREAMELAAQSGAEMIGLGAIIDRSPGVSVGMPFEALLKIQAQVWQAADCPLCSSGAELVAPGSRHLGGGYTP